MQTRQWGGNKTDATYDEICDGCADSHNDISAARGPQRAARRTELMRKLLKGERRFEHERYKAERERRGRHDKHE
jgi:hypothetical protein